jgi:hypothetical protein
MGSGRADVPVRVECFLAALLDFVIIPVLQLLAENPLQLGLGVDTLLVCSVLAHSIVDALALSRLYTMFALG